MTGGSPRSHHRLCALREEQVRAAIAGAVALQLGEAPEPVHGRVVPPDDALQAAAAARSLTVDALRRVLDSRPELLAMKNGEARSRHLIIGG